MMARKWIISKEIIFILAHVSGSWQVEYVVVSGVDSMLRA